MAGCCSDLKFVDSSPVGADSALVVLSGCWMYTPAPSLWTAPSHDLSK